MHQYGTNPSGELIAPPGLTIGVEDATKTVHHEDRWIRYQGDVVADSTFLQSTTPTQPEPTSSAKNELSMVNQCIFFIFPWLVSQGTFALMRYGHIMHISVIMGLARIYDFFRKLPEIHEEDLNPQSPLLGEKPKIMVIGDSMAVGIGCVNVFDEEKDSSKLKRIERLEMPPDESIGAPKTGPIFPKVLAWTLSQRLSKEVAWRSAGVDGGDTTDIREYLVGCVQEEADSGHPPDVVVVLTGANDLKRIISILPNSKPCASVRGFRSNLLELVQDIQKISPKTKVVLPALPTYRLDRNSSLNVFPLNFFLDALLGFWDSQKIRVGDKSRNVFYYGLTAKDVNTWYREERSRGNMAPTLLSVDGIHPNSKCYAKWATSLGNKLADTLEKEERSSEAQTPSRRKKPTTYRKSAHTTI
eukprot:CAMPEP_0195523716 /NCGR_PEP_ID=MMETSP0794_2-20130614/23057_1 /TAXON_ID=515487 /ORGANISM="Stephanopyxis turris, Strain CCMP 815" /LENGTH=414 /DNA_ID=CAMNT_0040653771 /DNA_START=393 /DNA_END=1637 /DNA_ORIENTATION=-